VIVIDASAALAILLEEPEESSYLRVIKMAGSVILSPANYLEIAICLESRRGLEIAKRLDAWLEHLSIEIAPITASQARLAREAYARFGKGRHPATLNICDCFAYALAKESDAALLFKGDDFAKTDIAPAL